MTTLVSTEASIPLALEEFFSRNLIGGEPRFPAAPYEFEIRSPSDSRIIAVVPLSSRFDVAQAVDAARVALGGGWSDREVRIRRLRSFVELLAEKEQDIAHVQSVETGLSPADSLAAVRITLREARSLFRCEAIARAPKAGGVSGHILSWGMPFTEVVTSVLPALVRGDAVVIKPSLRAPLSPALFGFLATESGLHPGVVNVVQGTGGDVGSELIRRSDLSGMYVRAGERTLAQAERGHTRTTVPLRTVRAGGNVAIVGAGGAVHLDQITATVASMVRMNSAGGPFGLPLLALHSDVAHLVTEAVVEELSTVVAAPLPTEPLRAAALARIGSLVRAGARPLLGGVAIPDDIAHRMGWRLPPTVLALGDAGSRAALTQEVIPALGPVLGIVTFTEFESLAGSFRGRRFADGVAQVRGIDRDASKTLPHGLLVTDPDPTDYTESMRISPAWTRCAL
jgi:acyl-CoA reductase-like NAD-dependent aldehyde dehydrogenase